MRTKTLHIHGMHCANCERTLKDEFSKIEGVQNVRINRKTNLAEIDYENKINLESATNKLLKLGYTISEKRIKDSNSASFLDWIYSFLIVLGFIVVYRTFSNLGFMGNLSFDKLDISLGISFLLGVAASISTCLAIVGSVVLAFGEKYESKERGFYGKAIKPNLLFHTGRLIIFFILGGILGLIGKEINISGNFISIFTIIVSIIMFWLGLSILGFLPSISNLGLRIPARFTNNFWTKIKNSNHKAAPFLLGALTFFLPCGFTQTMQLFALSSGNFTKGALSLGLFALGTMPVLFLLGLGASWAKNKKILIFQKVAGILVIIFSVYTFSAGLALKGSKLNVLSNAKNKSLTIEKKEIPVETAQQEQTVRMSIASSGFEPATMTVKKGIPVKWIINGDGATGCTNKIIVPKLNISQNIQKGENVITFTPTESGIIPFSCWMGMVRGKFVIE